MRTLSGIDVNKLLSKDVTSTQDVKVIVSDTSGNQYPIIQTQVVASAGSQNKSATLQNAPSQKDLSSPTTKNPTTTGGSGSGSGSGGKSNGKQGSSGSTFASVCKASGGTLGKDSKGNPTCTVAGVTLDANGKVVKDGSSAKSGWSTNEKILGGGLALVLGYLLFRRR